MTLTGPVFTSRGAGQNAVPTAGGRGGWGPDPTGLTFMGAYGHSLWGREVAGTAFLARDSGFW